MGRNFKKHTWHFKVFTFFIIAVMIWPFFSTVAMAASNPHNENWDKETLEWIAGHKNKPVIVSLDPMTGMDYFLDNGVKKGYLIQFLELVKRDTGLNFVIDDTLTWTQVLSGIKNGNVDLVFGANKTPEREAYMSFTEPLHQYPYAIYSSATGNVQTIGDLDGKMVGFLDGDLMGSYFDSIYKNISIHKHFYDSQTDGLKAVLNGSVAAFVTVDGGITKAFSHDYPKIKAIANVRTFTSDMTLAMRTEDEIFVKVLDQIIQNHSREIQSYIQQADQAYTIRMLKFTDEERKWLSNRPIIRVGAPTDYLPFDYAKDGTYQGIAGSLLTEMCRAVGIQLQVVEGTFDELYKKMENGDLDVLNMAKTADRQKTFNFTKAFSKEEDEIYGLRTKPYIQDIYELEGKRIAVVKGYWHKDYLLKNLSQVTIIETNDLKASLKAVNEDQADYFIENPTVAQYYIDGLGYSSILEKGHTAEDSFLYFGVNKKQVHLTNILNETLDVVSYDQIKSKALMDVPEQKNIMAERLTQALIVLFIALIGLVIFLIRLVQEVIEQKAQRKLFEEKEKLIYRDGLTGLFNRMYFNNVEEILRDAKLPQAFIISDLNGLKTVNDTYGHAAGDLYITNYAQAIQSAFPEGIHIRMGGDEFLIVISEASPEEIEKGIRLIDDICKNAGVQWKGEVISPHAAFGWALRTEESQAVDTLVAEADAMMYQHKASMRRRRSDW